MSLKNLMKKKQNDDKLENIKQLENQFLNIIDIGCRWGFAERFINEKYHSIMKIYGFDADKLECGRLKESYKNTPEGFINCVPLALAESPGKRNLYITKEPGCSSLYPPIKYLSDNFPALKCTALEKVISIDVTNLATWAKSNDIKTLDYIKIDTQGSELEILRGAGSLLETTVCIDIEVEFNPLYEGQSLFWETDAFLRSNGFSLWRLSNLVHYSSEEKSIELNEPNQICFDENIRQEIPSYGGQLYWADARYISKKIFFNSDFGSSKYDKKNLILFESLGMHDIVQQLRKLGKQ